MKREAMPIIRLEVEGLKQAMMHHMGLHNEELKDAMDLALSEEIKKYDIGKLILKLAPDIVGAYVEKCIEIAITEGLYPILCKENRTLFNDAINKEIRKQLSPVFKKKLNGKI